VCDAFTDFMDFAGNISAADVGVLLEEDAWVREHLYALSYLLLRHLP
jgi:hypothetical protein